MELSDLKILVVDDQKESRSILRLMLGDIGITNIVEAGDAKHAGHILDCEFKPVDLIFCDWNMPVISGIDFLKQIRQQGIQIPFLMISGRGDPDSIRLAKSSGVAVYLRKPFSPSQIEAKVRAVLHGM